MAQTDQTWSIWDLITGRSGTQGIDGNYGGGFIFTTVSGRTRSGENVDVDNLLEEATVTACITNIVQGVTQVPMKVKRKTEKGYEELPNHLSLIHISEPTRPY